MKKKFRNIELSSPRRLENATPHFTFQVQDERRIVANILTLLAAKSPTRGIYYINQFSTDGLYSSLMTKKIPSSRERGSDTVIGAKQGGRLSSLVNSLGAATKFIDPSKHPMTRYYQTLKHSDLYSPDDRSGIDPIFDSALLTLMAEQPGSVVQFPIGELMMSLFSKYIETDTYKKDGESNMTEAAIPKNLRLRANGQFLRAAAFTSSADIESSDLHVQLKNLFFLEFGDNWPKDVVDGGSLNSDKSLAKTLILADTILNIDLIVDSLKKSGVQTFNVKAEDKIAGIRKTVSLMMAILTQPYLMYVRMLLDVINNPVTATFLQAKYPNLANSELIASLTTMMDKIKFTPLYNEIIRHYRVDKMDTAIGQGSALIVPAGLAHYMPFIVTKSDGTAKPMSDKDKDKAKATEGKAISGIDLSLLTAGTFNAEEEMSLTSELSLARSVIETYILGDPQNEADYNEAIGSLSGGAVPGFRSLDRYNLNVLFTDTVLASEKLDYDAITEGLLIPQLAMLSPSPQRKGIILHDGNRTGAEKLTRSIHSVGEIIFANVNTPDKDKLSNRLLDAGLSLIGISLDPWFDKFTVGSKAILNGRIPMTRYNADLDGAMVPHSTLANFASDIGLDPRLITSIIDEKDSRLQTAYGPTMISLLSEFFTSGDVGFTIPDAEEYGLRPNTKFAFAHYLVSSRGRVLSSYLDVALNATLPSIQRIVYNDWGRSGMIKIASTQNALIDHAFESSILDEVAVLSHSCSDIFTRLKA